ncbi:MAG: Fur family zinc uptake transcriptional regulator [Paracoccaceae bacterium]|jgi:Fur family zinc uptake transcriptional regulator
MLYYNSQVGGLKMETLSFEKHDHRACIAKSLEIVVRCCKEAELQFTPTRKKVLEILLEEHRALGAYEILEKLRADGISSQPPVAYRALDFLVKNGFAHKIEGLNAFIACTILGKAHSPAFLICRMCAAVAESQPENSREYLDDTAQNAGFLIENTVIEAQGLCPKCQRDSVG